MLTRTRATIMAGIAVLATTTSLAAAPAASASTLPAPAAGKLVHELLSAWQITKGEGVTVAVLSTGVDPVTGLAGKITKGPDYAPTKGIPYDDGTMLASLIASSGPSARDPLGTIGRAPGVRILSLQMVDWGAGHGSGKYQQDVTWQNLEAEAIRYAVSHGAQVIVTDEYGGDDQQSLDEAVAYAMSKNVVVLGNGGVIKDNPVLYPDSLPGVINFSWTTVAGAYGPLASERTAANSSVLVTAPANTVFATCRGDQLCFADDDYSAVSWVAATVALIKAVYPHLSPALVARALALSASYRPAGGYNTKIGFGLINPSGALQEASTLASLHNTAGPGAGVVSATAHFGGGPATRTINAVQHSTAKLAGYAAAVVIGLLLLLFALLLRRRWRRAAASAVTPPPPVDAPPALP